MRKKTYAGDWDARQERAEKSIVDAMRSGAILRQLQENEFRRLAIQDFGFVRAREIVDDVERRLRAILEST